MTTYADQYREARGRSTTNLLYKPKRVETKPSAVQHPIPNPQQKSGHSQNSGSKSKKDIECFLCNRKGHYSYECRTKQNTLAAEADER